MKKNTTKLLWVLLLCYMLHPHHIAGQTYNITNYSIMNGLSTNAINDITQDKVGRIWVATNNGVSQYDGLNWINLGKHTGSARYTRIICDERGVIWAVPQSIHHTILYISNDSIGKLPMPTFSAEDEKGNNSSIIVTYENNNPVVHLGTYSGLYVFKNNNWNHYSTKDELMDGTIFSMCQSGNNIVFCTREGLCTFSNDSLDYSLSELLLPGYNLPCAVHLDTTNHSSPKMWLLGEAWLGYIENGKLKIINDNLLQLPRADFTTTYYPICTGKGGDVLYFGNTRFTYMYRISTNEYFPLLQENGFQGDGCNSLFTDREGNLWRCWNRGVDKLCSNYIVNLNAKGGLLEDEVTAIYEYAPGKMLLGHNNGITFFSKNDIKKI